MSPSSRNASRTAKALTLCKRLRKKRSHRLRPRKALVESERRPGARQKEPRNRGEGAAKWERDRGGQDKKGELDKNAFIAGSMGPKEREREPRARALKKQ